MRKKNPLLQVQSDPLQVQEAREIKPTTELKEIDREIECPRCHDVMILSSEFGRLGYSCEECSFLLYLT
jgi:rubredoxin